MKTNWTSETPFHEIMATIDKYHKTRITSVLWVASKEVYDVVLKTTTLEWPETARGQGHTLQEALENAFTRLKQNTTRP